MPIPRSPQRNTHDHDHLTTQRPSRVPLIWKSGVIAEVFPEIHKLECVAVSTGVRVLSLNVQNKLNIPANYASTARS